MPWLYELVRTRRARAQEAEYILLREQYYHEAESLFAEPGYLPSSRELLYKHWKGPKQVKSSRKEVRLFAAGATVIGGGRPLAELVRSFDIASFDYTEHCRKVLEGNSEPPLRIASYNGDHDMRQHLQREIPDCLS